MIGNSIGAGKEGLAKDYAQKFSGLAIVVGIVLGAILALTSPLILNFFNVSYTVRNHAQIILYMISAIFFMRVLGIMLIVGVLRGGGDAGTAFLIEGFTMWFVGVPLTILGALVFQFPVYIVFGLAIIEEFCKCILSLMRLRSGKWIKNVTHNMA
jgi:Na+-driven multidrug efflux pump